MPIKRNPVVGKFSLSASKWKPNGYFSLGKNLSQKPKNTLLMHPIFYLIN